MAIQRESLLTLEAYAKARAGIREQVLAHKKRRTVAVGPSVTLVFEDETTVRYQIQEMLRIEKTFEEEGIRDELAAYNPLVPDGTNLKATMMIEYTDADERARELARLIGIEDRVFLQVGDRAPAYAVADEDLDRSNADKTSAVHFLRFELSPDAIAAFRAGAPVSIGIDHPNYRTGPIRVAPDVQESLAGDFALSS